MSGTAPAWQAREMQQHEFVESLLGEVSAVEDEREEPYTFSAEVAQCVLQHLVGMLHDAWSPPETSDSQSAAEGLLENTILPRARTFARTANERGLVLTKLLENLLGGSVGQLQHEWQAEVLRDSIKTLGTRERMEEVPIPSGG